MNADGCAFLDRSGDLVAADDGFSGLLGLPRGRTAESLRRRAQEYPALARFLAGEGPTELLLSWPERGHPCVITRRSCDGGTILTAWTWAAAADPSPLELALQGLALARVEGGFAHDVKNPLNAMALQLALLGDKISTASDALAVSCGGNLASLKNQIGRINELLRCHAEVTDPVPGSRLDLSALLSDAARLFGHEARRRAIAFELEAGAASLPVTGDAARVTRLVLGLLAHAFVETADGGRVALATATPASAVTLTIDHGGAAEAGGGSLGWALDAARACACALGGELRTSRHGDGARVELVLPRERAS